MRNFRERPIVDGERDRLFCCHCDHDRNSEKTMRDHLKMVHDVYHPQAGPDYLSAAGVERLLAGEDAAVEVAAYNIESLIGVDDFLLECGADA